MKRSNLLVLALSSLFFSFFGFCVELDPIGHVFPITDVDPIQILKEKYKNLSHQEKEDFFFTFQKATKKNLSHPQGVFLEKATKYRSFTYDPSVVLEEDIFDHQGKVLAGKGTVVNPLKTITLSYGLLFLDGNDSQEVAWAKQQKNRWKWILVSGNPNELSEKLDQEIYFDQGGIYMQRFGIEKTPSKVTQVQELLKIEEIPVR